MQPFFENFHKAFYDNGLKTKFQDIQVIAQFNIDTEGNITNLSYALSGTLKNAVNYVIKMLPPTNGHWLPQFKNGNLSISNSITCSFYFVKKAIIPTKERLQRIELQQGIANGWIDMSNLFWKGEPFDYKNWFIYLEF
ncbi:MAG: hypothetical protein H7258_07035 [Ferruginibacter sp.]|nr:hypothetical protein [Ferruginibacter sp.]